MSKAKSGRSQKHFAKKLEPYAYLSPTLITMAVLMLVPITMVILYSFLDNAITNDDAAFVGFANYLTVLSNPKFWDAVQHTIVFCVLSVVGHLLLALAFAMMLNSSLLGKTTKAIFRVILIVPWVFTSAIVATLWRLIMNPNGVLNYMLETLGITSTNIEWLSSHHLALYSLIFINVWAAYPFFMISILAGLQGIGADIYEAATVDGANGIQKFFRITIPQLKPILVSMIMLDSIWTTQQFSLVWMITGGGPGNATDLLGSFTYRLAFTSYKFSLASTSAVLILLVVMVLAFIYANYQKAGE